MKETLEEVKDLSYWKANAEEDYMKVPISVLRYITELENRMYSEEDLVQLLNFVSREYNISNGIGWFHTHESNEDVTSKEVLDKWFEQFKKGM
jgi:hypothetical protein